MTRLADALARGQQRLEDAGFPPVEARRDAALLARHVLAWDAAEWLVRSREPAPADFLDRFLPLAARRAGHEPIAYIIGTREFYGRSFVVTPDVLIPRPETELVVEEALAVLRPAPLIVDVGTGSGCLAITLALERAAAHVVGTDVSGAALGVARENAHRLGVADRVELRGGAFLAGVKGPVDAIVSNPPYVAESERASLAREVVEFEPASALFAGPDGLAAIRALLPLAASTLAPGGWLVLEIGHGQADDVRGLIDRTAGLVFERARNDLQGIPRVVVARTR